VDKKEEMEEGKKVEGSEAIPIIWSVDPYISFTFLLCPKRQNVNFHRQRPV
jgi:hypothetical protein